MSPRDVWANPESYATTLLTLFHEQYVLPYLTTSKTQDSRADEENPLNWDPETIALEIEDDHNIALPRLVHDRLMAAIQLYTTDVFYHSLPDFIDLCNVLAGTPLGTSFDPADSLEVAWGITESLLIAQPDSEEPFTDEIRGYIGGALDHEGIMNAPDILQLAIRNVNQGDVQGDFADDPQMFNAMYDAEAAKTADINRAIRVNLQALVMQLRSLELEHGDTSKVDTLLKELSKMEQRDTNVSAEVPSFIL